MTEFSTLRSKLDENSPGTTTAQIRNVIGWESQEN